MFRFFSLSHICTGAILSLIIWAITQANSGSHNAVFKWIAALPYGDKIGHFLLFGSLAFFLSLALKRASFRLFRNRVYWGCALVLGFALTEEASQHFLPTRTLDIWDFAADTAGIFSAAVFIKLKEVFSAAR